MDKLKPLSSQSGLSLLELMIAVGLVAIVALAGSSLLSNISTEKLVTENRNVIRQTTSTLQKVVNRVSSKVTHTQYDPFNVVDFSNKKIGSEWIESNAGQSFSGSASTNTISTQEKGVLKQIYNKPSNSSQVLNSNADLKFIPGCDGCSSCETFLDKTSSSASVLNNNTTCAPLNSCLYYSLKVGSIFKEIISKCNKPTTTSSGFKVLALSVDKFSGAQTSHDLVFTDLTINKSSSTINKADYKSNAVYMSRCVPVDELKVIDSYSTYDRINVLRRPFIKENQKISTSTVTVDKLVNGRITRTTERVSTYSSANVVCCTSPKELSKEWMDDCLPISSGDNAKFLPTIFVYKGDGSVSTWPALSERLLIPGLALIMQIDNKSAKSFKLTTLQIENACKSGRKRASWPCSADKNNPYIPKNGEFDSQVEIKLIFKSGSVAAGLSSGGIMNLGDSVNYNN